ncbi:MAG: hypothetical protein EBR19_04380 [Chitinophagaceae bacterium]|nr:hypothetical protein [Chitinophagaceae bacterium]
MSVLGFNSIVYAQNKTPLSPASIKKLEAHQDTLKEFAYYLNTDSLTEDRMIADSQFTRTLVSVKGVAKLYAPDSSFRIITWNLQYDDYYCRQRGAIQMNTKNGALKLFPLRDASEFTDHPEDSVRSVKNWIGATYYNVIKKEYQGKSFYTLFGIDANNAMSTIKWMEVLHFSQQGEPIFGGPFFSYERDSIPVPAKYRIQLEYKKNARVLLNYIPDMDLILMDHLISENDDSAHKWTYVPDGDQEGFRWEKGKWVHINKVFTQKLRDGQAPREIPLFEKKN